MSSRWSLKKGHYFSVRIFYETRTEKRLIILAHNRELTQRYGWKNCFQDDVLVLVQGRTRSHCEKPWSAVQDRLKDKGFIIIETRY